MTESELIFNRRPHRARHLCAKAAKKTCPNVGCVTTRRPGSSFGKFMYLRGCCGTFCIGCGGRIVSTKRVEK
jgi:hypothetical protein